MIRKSKDKKVRSANIGTKDSVRTKIANMCIAKTTLKTTLLAKVAEMKVAEKGTERHVELGMVMGVEEKKDVPTSIKTPMNPKEEKPPPLNPTPWTPSFLG